MSDIKERQLLTAILKDILYRGPQLRSSGICGNVRVLAQMLHGYDSAVWSYWRDVNGGIFENWPEFSGNIYYPVPSGNRILPANDMYTLVHDLWESQYGEARFRLLDFLITSLESGDYDDA